MTEEAGTDDGEGTGVRPGEWPLVLWAAAWFFFVLFSWFLLRPLRELFGISDDLRKLPWLFLGVIHLRNHDDEAAIEAFTRSLEVSPNQIEGHMRLGEIYLRLGRGADAVRAFESALAVEGNFAEARQRLAEAVALRDRSPRS